MNTFSQMFKDALLAFIQERGEEGAVKIIDFEEEVIEWGGCSTCSYSETVVEITYEDAEEKYSTYKHEGSFVDLIRALTAEH